MIWDDKDVIPDDKVVVQDDKVDMPAAVYKRSGDTGLSPLMSYGLNRIKGEN
ncbi:MAG: hypothetical protein KAW12_14310 [Candidatus Aminicenantes bacterium]|nr:hypothetical protein [Candidatus Aminicenantes bacterium]